MTVLWDSSDSKYKKQLLIVSMEQVNKKMMQ